MNNQVRITYNPYEKKISYEYRSDPHQDWGELYPGSGLAQDKYQHGALQNHAEDIIKAIITDCCSAGKGVDLFFRGTLPDWRDLKEIISQVDVRHQICCCDSDASMISADEALTQINKIFDELSAHFEESSDSKVKEIIQQYLTTIQPEIVLVVVGAYSAGKSTFINALIGEEILPTASKPTTAKVFKISSLPTGNWQDIEIRFGYGKHNIQIRFNQNGYYIKNIAALPSLELKYCLDTVLKSINPSPAYVYHLISVLNQFNEMKKNASDYLISEMIEIDVPFHLSTLPLDRYHFTIYDTPGPDAARHREHREMLENALLEQTNGLPLFLTEPDNMSSETVDKLRTQLSGIKVLDESNIMIVVNKADEKGSSTLSDIKEKHFHSVAQEGAENRVFFVSSLVAFGAKKADITQCVFRDIPDLFEEKSPKFLTGKSRLYSYDILPQYRYQSICAEGEKINESKNSPQLLLHNSGLWAIEDEISRFAEKYAAYNKSQQAQKYLSLAIEAANADTEYKKKEQASLLSQITNSMDNKKQVLICELRAKCCQMQAEHSSEYLKKIRHTLDELYKGEISKISKTSLQKQWKELRKNDSLMQRYITETFKAMQENVESNLYAESHAFWKANIDLFKKTCIEIVTESHAFSKSENSFLKKYILDCPQPEFEQISFNFDIQGKKSWRFLFWCGKDFDAKTCADNMDNSWKDHIARVSNIYLEHVQSIIKKWYDSFIEDLIAQCAEFNPELKGLLLKRKECEREISRLSSLVACLIKQQEKILHLFQFDSEGL